MLIKMVVYSVKFIKIPNDKISYMPKSKVRLNIANDIFSGIKIRDDEYYNGKPKFESLFNFEYGGKTINLNDVKVSSYYGDIVSMNYPNYDWEDNYEYIKKISKRTKKYYYIRIERVKLYHRSLLCQSICARSGSLCKNFINDDDNEEVDDNEDRKYLYCIHHFKNPILYHPSYELSELERNFVEILEILNNLKFLYNDIIFLIMDYALDVKIKTKYIEMIRSKKSSIFNIINRWREDYGYKMSCKCGGIKNCRCYGLEKCICYCKCQSI